MNDKMKCKQCGKVLPEGCAANRKYCDECLQRRKKARRKKYYMTVEKGSIPSAVETVTQIRTPEDGYILLASKILERFSSEYESVLRKYKDEPSQKNKLQLQEYENRLMCEFEYYRILTLGALDDAEAFVRSMHLKTEV